IPLIPLDGDQIRQVLLNIILNAIQAMPNGGRLDIRSDLKPATGPVRVEISDTGEGLGEQDLEHVFDPFFTTKPEGTGLGLAISYQLIKNHGGDIKVHRNRVGGLTFGVELPLQGWGQEGGGGAERGSAGDRIRRQ
ncbi:MAG: PAS domain-containing sensor histidine kinase, partial [Acidobacteriota bacterium]